MHGKLDVHEDVNGVIENSYLYMYMYFIFCWRSSYPYYRQCGNTRKM